MFLVKYILVYVYIKLPFNEACKKNGLLMYFHVNLLVNKKNKEVGK